ncbi:cytochrome P450 [Chaetomidium leptoderma]|uniref:Cytochrome P450 n=1 Tax=Chaetomidium leptoderma TaxID=669021 RepID=A0AAN6VRI7_9PEZI|nr:cytochrome P450 [Chaetomidium leptoderma]
MAFLASLSERAISRPSTSVILYYVLGFLLLVHAIRRVRGWYRLRHIPGPALAGWTSLWLTRRYLKGTFCQDVPALVDRYGPVVRVAPDKIVCTDITTMYRISGVRSDYKKSEWYTISRVSRDGDHILSLIDPELRKERKKYIMPAYTGRGVDDFEEGIDRALASWIDLIERKYISTPGKNAPMNFEEKAHFYSLDAVGEIAYSESFECVKQDKDTKGVLGINDATIPILMAVGNYVALWRILRMWPFYLLFPNDGDECGFGAIVGQAKKLVAKRLQPDAKPKRDMLQSFIAHGLRGEPLSQEVGIQFFAGSDSIASALYTTLLLLLTHPSVYTRLQTELDTANKTSPPATDGSPPPTIIHDSQARSLPYLQAVIREGLRLFPPLTAAPAFKEVPARGDDVCGFPLPGGTLVATANAILQGCREKGFWGEDGDCFRPERWLEADDSETYMQMLMQKKRDTVCSSLPSNNPGSQHNTIRDPRTLGAQLS